MELKSSKIKVAIDPDVRSSGIALIEKGQLKVMNMGLFQLYEWFKLYQTEIEIVHVEASWLISNNFTAISGTTSAKLKIANRTGANHEIGRKIVEALELLNIKYKLVPPLKKIWKGINKKITHKELMDILQVKKLGFNERQTNQEQRDAVLLIL